MSKIQVMDEILANKIAAGEVVEKCMNVVKELVENAIDARSKEITIKLIDSGVKEIEVSDDGIGMDEEDAKLAFQRHATSKLKSLDDLFYIESLGFRGEALPSIASVSNALTCEVTVRLVMAAALPCRTNAKSRRTRRGVITPPNPAAIRLECDMRFQAPRCHRARNGRGYALLLFSALLCSEERGAKLPAAQRDEHVLCGAIPLVLCA